MYTTVEAYLDNGAVTTKEFHPLPKNALVLLTVLKSENEGDSHEDHLCDVVSRTAGVMHENIDSVKWQRDLRAEWCR